MSPPLVFSLGSSKVYVSNDSCSYVYFVSCIRVFIAQAYKTSRASYRQTPGYLPANRRSFIRLSPDQWVSVTPSSVTEASIVLHSLCLWLVWVNVQSACSLTTGYGSMRSRSSSNSKMQLHLNVIITISISWVMKFHSWDARHIIPRHSRNSWQWRNEKSSCCYICWLFITTCLLALFFLFLLSLCFFFLLCEVEIIVFLLCCNMNCSCDCCLQVYLCL
jgi:hypothetical protein